MVNAQEWLDKNYPKDERRKITELDISKKSNSSQLWGIGETLWDSLFLEGFTNLESLSCRNQRISNLILSDCASLKIISCSDNQLTNLEFLNDLSNPEKLTNLDIHNNKIQLTDLTCFARFVNLELLWIGTSKKKNVEKGIINHFHGSLEPLKNLSKLETLSISHTDIDSGLEYLPDSLKNFYSSTTSGTNFKVKKISKILSDFDEDIEKWRLAGKPLLSREEGLEKKVQQLKEELQREKAKVDKLNQMDQEISTIIQRTGERLKENKTKRKVLETQLSDVQEQFQTNQAEIESLKAEINVKQTQIETHSFNQELVSQLQAEKNNLEYQLAIKKEQFAFLQEENQELIRKCYSHLEIIEGFKKSQEVIDTIKSDIKRGNFELVDTLCQKQNELTRLEIKLEKIIKEEKPSLMKKLKMDNENWEEELVLGMNSLAINQLEKQVKQTIITINNLSVNGSANIGNQFGDSANFNNNYATKIEEIELEAKIQQTNPCSPNQGSSR